MIELTGVGKLYGNRWAIRDLTFTAQPGEVLGFLGPNGAGKTTTMRIVTGYMPPTTGSVRVAGVDALEDPVRLKSRVGYLPEIPPVYGEMSVQGYLSFVAEMRRVPRHRRKAHVSEIMERVGVADVAGRLAGRLSRGYKQRLGLGAALVGYPPVLVLDEPTSGLDPQQIIEMRQLIRSLAGQHTILLSSHILPEVASTCGRVLILNRGRLVAQDTPENLSLRLRGGRRLRLEVRGLRGAIEDALAEVPAIRRVQFAAGGPGPAGQEGPGAAPPGPGGEDGVEGERPQAEGAQAPAPAPYDGQPEGDSPAVWRVLVEVGADAGAGGPDPREAIFFSLARRNLPLLEMRALDVSLEEVFLQLVTEETPQAQTA